MNTPIKIWGVLLSILINMVSPVYAQFEDLGSAARPLGMGNAFTAVATDVNALYYNPAGLARLNANEITTSYTRLLLGLSDQSVLGGGYVAGVLSLNDLLPLQLPWYPAGKHGIGVAYTNVHLLGAYQEHTITFGYGLELQRDLAVGLSVKGLFSTFVQDAYTALDPLFQRYGAATGNVGLDLGVLWQPLPNYRVALTAVNLNQPNMALSGEDRVPMLLKLGVAYRSFGLDVVTDLTYQPATQDLRAAFGLEKWLAERALALRAGLVAGSREDRDLTVGGSVRSDQIQFDYAFVYPLAGLANTLGTHRVAFSVRLGPDARESDEEFTLLSMVPKALYDAEVAKATAAAQLAQAEVDILKAKLATTMADAQKAQDEATRQPSAASLEEQAKLKQALDEREATLQTLTKDLEIAQAKLAEIEHEKQARLDAAKKAKEAREAQEAAKNGETGGTDNSALRTPHSAIPKTYSVKEGDTLRSLAKTFYGDENKWMEIYRLNAGAIRQGIVMPGQVIYLPGGK